MLEREELKWVVFISRAGEDKEIARHVAKTLNEAGYKTFLQDEDFGHASFMERMAQGFEHVERGGCLVVLLSEAYQCKPHCLKEARYPLTSDPFNTKEKLIVLRIDDISPRDFLKDIPYVDLASVSLTDPAFDTAVVSAVERSLSAHASDGASARPALKRIDEKVEKLMIFLENEDAEESGKAMLNIVMLFSAIGLALILLEQAISMWNWVFKTEYYAIFDTSFVIALWSLMCVGMLFALYWQVRCAARTIEDAHLKVSQLRELRSRVAAQAWRSDWFVKAIIQAATRNITARQ